MLTLNYSSLRLLQAHVLALKLESLTSKSTLEMCTFPAQMAVHVEMALFICSREQIHHNNNSCLSQKEEKHPATYDYFEEVWALRNHHAATHFPSQYIFSLVCCLQPECVHPVCNSQVITQLPPWYEGGPPVSCIPLPIPDPDRPWGGMNCDQCKGACYGHFLKPLEALTSSLSPMTVPPSGLLKEAFKALHKYPPSHEECVALSRKVLLSPDQALTHH